MKEQVELDIEYMLQRYNDNKKALRKLMHEITECELAAIDDEQRKALFHMEAVVRKLLKSLDETLKKDIQDAK